MRAGEGCGSLLLVENGAEVLGAAAIGCAVEERVGDLCGERADRAVLTASCREGHGQEVRQHATEL
jgi:hypothetical protein